MLVDSPPAEPSELKPADAVTDGAPGSPVDPSTPPPVDQTCAKCGAAMALGQDWCLQCGAGAPGSIGTPGWRSAATAIGVALVLALGAAAAGYAALSHKKRVPATVTTTVAAATPPPAAATPGVAVPTTPAKAALPLGTVKPSKIPLTAVVPKIPATTTPITPTATPTTPATTPSGSGAGGAEPGSETKPAAILLDTNAATTYNPYNYPASEFGDPSLTIDGDSSTGWTAQVRPTTAPKMAEGVLINLKGRQKLSALKLTTSTPGMTVQVYGVEGHTAPASITDAAWVPLSHYQVVAKKHIRIKLKDASKSFTYLTLWISNAPASSVGTAEAPGHVSVNEIELFPSA